MKRRMYYNPEEMPVKIRFISNERGVDETVIPSEDYRNFPTWFEDLFKAMKKHEYDEIVVAVTEHDCCYYYNSQGERVPLIGEVELSKYSDGGGYLKDIKLMLR